MKNIITRLSFIKYLYDFAVKQSYKPYPYSIISLLIFHDSLEYFNILALEYKTDKTKEINFVRKKEQEPNFIQYWDILGLTQKESMIRFNKARINLKHYGNWPSKIDLESFRASITNFFEENTIKIFNKEFSEISLIDLINNDAVRELIKECEKYINDDKIKEALINIALAFAMLFRGIDIKIGEPLPSMRLNDYGITLKNGYKMESYFDKLNKSINSIDEAIKCNFVGINYQRYLKFRATTPRVTFSISGKPYFDLGRTDQSIEEIRYCVNFVIEAALSIQHYTEK